MTSPEGDDGRALLRDPTWLLTSEVTVNHPDRHVVGGDPTAQLDGHGDTPCLPPYTQATVRTACSRPHADTTPHLLVRAEEGDSRWLLKHVGGDAAGPHRSVAEGRAPSKDSEGSGSHQRSKRRPEDRT